MKTKHNSSSQDSSKKIDILQFPYKHTTEMQMIFLHGLLPEKHKRLYAASEALKLGHGGISYIATVLNCDRKTIYRGISELKNPETIQRDKIRAKGGGRKKSIDIIPNIDEKFLGILKDFTAGDPMDEKIRWTNLTLQQIADKLKKEGIEVSKKIVKQLFKKHGYTKRKAQKSVSIGQSKDRNKQFEIIAKIKKTYNCWESDHKHGYEKKGAYRELVS